MGHLAYALKWPCHLLGVSGGIIEDSESQFHVRANGSCSAVSISVGWWAINQEICNPDFYPHWHYLKDAFSAPSESLIQYSHENLVWISHESQFTLVWIPGDTSGKLCLKPCASFGISSVVYHYADSVYVCLIPQHSIAFNSIFSEWYWRTGNKLHNTGNSSVTVN